MKLRLAKKISSAMTNGRGQFYTNDQQENAVNRNARTKSSRQATAFWNAMMEELGPEGRAEFFVQSGDPKTALGILMRSPIEEWPGKPGQIVKCEPAPHVGRVVDEEQPQ